MMKKIFFRLLAISLLLSACTDTENLFCNPDLQEAFDDFVREVGADDLYAEAYYQVVAGNNRKGTKVDFIATPCFLSGPLYFTEAASLSLLGYSEKGKATVSVYGCEGDRFDGVFNRKPLSRSFQGSPAPAHDKVYSMRASYQVDKDGKVVRLEHDGKDGMLVYDLSSDVCKGTLVLVEAPPVYSIILQEASVTGSWERGDDASLHLTPATLSRYSAVKDEMLSFPPSAMAEILNGNVREILENVSYRQAGTGLFPLADAEKEDFSFFWTRRP